MAQAVSIHKWFLCTNGTVISRTSFTLFCMDCQKRIKATEWALYIPRLVHFIFECLFSFLPCSSQVLGFYTKPVDSPAPSASCFLNAYFLLLLSMRICACLMLATHAVFTNNEQNCSTNCNYWEAMSLRTGPYATAKIGRP